MNKAYEYCLRKIDAPETPRYVRKQMREFMDICEDKDPLCKISQFKVNQIECILKLLIMPKGLKAGQTLYECSTGYQWITYTASLCTVYRSNEQKRRYETVILVIGRKNFKTYTIATIFIILFLTEPNFSKLFSVAPDSAISKEIKDAISETLRCSPLIYMRGKTPRFNILRDYILFKPTETRFTPLAFSTSRMDSRLPNCFIADEVGALPTNYPIEAMRSGQLNILNKLGFIISTRYNSIDNPLEDEVDHLKRVLDGIDVDETVFGLLYEPDETKDFLTNDLILQQANPAAMEVPEIWEDLLKKRAAAVSVKSRRENFATKHCNIIYFGSETQTYVDVNDVQACRVDSIDWRDRVVYLGFDLSHSDDNTSVAMVSMDGDDLLVHVMAFVPEGKVAEKSISEKVSYFDFQKSGNCIFCGDRKIDYGVVEDYILKLQERFGVKVQGFGYDIWNALSTVAKLEAAGLEGVMVKQHSSVLHPVMKLLKEKVLDGQLKYTDNRLLEINFQNARCVYDMNENLYVAKKKSKGKVDMLFSIFDALYVLQQNQNTEGFFVQLI